MITKHLKSLVVAAVAAAALGTAQAQELKIGYVNSERVLREASPAKAALARMESDFSKRDKDLNDQGAKLKAAADKLEKDAPTLSEGERNRRQRDAHRCCSDQACGVARRGHCDRDPDRDRGCQPRPA